MHRIILESGSVASQVGGLTKVRGRRETSLSLHTLLYYLIFFEVLHVVLPNEKPFKTPFLQCLFVFERDRA